MYDYKAKAKNVATLNHYMLAKTLSMFEYENLPDSIPYNELEKMLQVNGFAFITKVDGELYAFYGGIGGEPDVYGNPTTIAINNPALKFNKTLDIKKDGVLIKNDDMAMGLIPLYEKHHTLMVENDINIVVNGYNSRMQKLISAPDDKTKQSAEAFVKRAVDGDIAIIGENGMFDGIKVQSGATTSAVSVTTMIEFNQYIKANLYNEVGLSANFNMKRERLISSEVEAGEDSLFPFVYNMMKCRLKAIEKINEMYGTDIKIDFGSVWYYKNAELVDDVVNPNKEQTPEPEPEKAKDKDELLAMLEDQSLSDEDKQAVKELLAELEGEE